MQTAKTHDTRSVSQFELTKILVNNLSQFEITPTDKLVLLYLSTCYNPEHSGMFPKQSTIATKLGISERSVVKAIQSLVKAGLILVGKKYFNTYKFTSKISNMDEKTNSLTTSLKEDEFFENYQEKFADSNCKKFIQQGEKFSHLYREQIKEQKITTNEDEKNVVVEINNFEDEKILREYAKKKGAHNILAYVAVLKKNGAAKVIIEDFKKQQQRKINQKKKHGELLKIYKQYELEASEPTQEWKDLKAKLLVLKNKK